MAEPNKGVLLFVDDEKGILSSLQKVFKQLNYTVYIASTGYEGLKILNNNPVDIVISDIRMPEMDGNVFLNIVESSWPKIKRIILTGYQDEINHETEYFIAKPWQNEKFIELVNQVMSSKSLNPTLVIKHRLFNPGSE